MYAIIATGGKQYKVAEGDIIKVEKLGVEAGETYTFDQVLAVNNDKLIVGNPTVEGATVTASVVGNGKARKVVVYKYKRKTGYHKKNGHRQQYTAVKIDKIKHEYAGFDISGHAGYAESGHDIICAAVSALVINTLNSIEQFTDDKTDSAADEASGTIEFRFLERPSHDAALLLDSMILGLEEIEDSSESEAYIDIIFKEV